MLAADNFDLPSSLVRSINVVNIPTADMVTSALFNVMKVYNFRKLKSVTIYALQSINGILGFGFNKERDLFWYPLE